MAKYFTDSGGAAGVIRARMNATAAAREKDSKPAKKSGGFSLGDVVPDLGLGQMVKELGMIVPGMLAVATGKGGYSNAIGGLAKGLGSSVLGTASTIAKPIGIPGTDINLGDRVIEPLGEKLTGIKPQDFMEKVRERGILPALVEDVGNVALAGGVASKFAKSGQLGALANESVQAARLSALPGNLKFSTAAQRAKEAAQAVRDSGAAKAFSPEQIAGRAKVIDVAQKVAHPYTTGFQRFASPLARAGEAEALARSAGAVMPDAEIPSPTAATGGRPRAPQRAVATDIAEGGQFDPALASRAPIDTPEFDVQTPRVGPAELSARAVQSAEIPEWATRFVQKAPDPVVDTLRKVSGFIAGRQTAKVKREHEIFQEAVRRKFHNEAPVKNILARASDVVGKELADGTSITPEIADQMFGDEIMRLMAHGPWLDEVKARVGDSVDIDALLRSKGAIPEHLMTPEIRQAVNDAAEFFATDVNKRRLEVMRGSRRGNEGLEDVGTTNVALRKSDQKRWNEARDLQARATKLDPRIAKERERATAMLVKAQERIADIDSTNAALRTRSAEIVNEIAELWRRGHTGSARWAPGDDLKSLGKDAGPLPDRSPRQLANTAGTVEGLPAAAAQKRGATLERKATEHSIAQQRITENTNRRAKLQTSIDDIRRTMDEESLASEIEKAKLLGKASKKVARLQQKLDTPGVSQVSSHWQPLYSAAKELHKLAEADPVLAEALEGMPKTFSDVVRFAKERGFEPAHIASITNDDVRRLVFDQVRLGRGGAVGLEAKAGARNKRNTGTIRTRAVSALAAGMFQATEEANSNAVLDYLESTVAQKVRKTADGQTVLPKGWRLWNPDAHFKTSVTREGGAYIVDANTGQRIPTMMIPEQVGKVLDRMADKQKNPLLNPISKVTNPWRALMLTWSPRWYVNNIVSQVILASSEGVKWSDWRAAYDEYKKDGTLNPEITQSSLVSDISTDLGGMPSLVAYPGKFKQRVGLARRQEGNVAAYRHIAKSVSRANEFVDELSRAAVYNRTLRVGGTAEQALMRAQTALIDYGNMTPFERQYVKAIVPFYAWQKNVLKIVSLFPVDHPAAAGVLMQLDKLNQDLNERQYGGKLPDAYAGLITIAGKTINTRAWNPFQDADQLASPQGIAASINPVVDIALRNALGAPDGGFVKHTRANEFGTYVPDTSPLQDALREVSMLPQLNLGTALASGKSATGQGRAQTSLRFAGIPGMTPEQIAKVVARAKRTEERLEGTRAKR